MNPFNMLHGVHLYLGSNFNVAVIFYTNYQTSINSKFIETTRWFHVVRHHSVLRK